MTESRPSGTELLWDHGLGRLIEYIFGVQERIGVRLICRDRWDVTTMLGLLAFAFDYVDCR